jgi:putative transposase
LQVLTASKAEYAGKKVKLCIANGTSQTCHVCGNIQKMRLRDRIFRCHQCGNIMDRDVNSANVVLDRCKCTAGTVGIEACKSGLSRDIMK